MKVLSVSLIIGVGLFAQSPTSRPAPGTTATTPATAAPSSSAPTLGAPATPVTPETVVAKVGGKDYTAAEMDKLLSELPPQFQQAIARQPQLVTNMFMLRNLAQQAELENLDKEPRYQQQLEYQRMSVLAQAAMNHFRETISVKPEDQKAYYERNKEQYRIATVKAIYVSFAPVPKPTAPGAPAAKTEGRTQDEAKKKIEDLRKQILAGADFAKLASEQSDDKTSAAKGGDYGDIAMNGPYSEKVKVAIFKLKPGEVSEPVQEASGFYLFKLVNMTVQPFDKVSNQVVREMQQGEFQAWINGIQAKNKVTIENSAWFASRNAR